eukprot:10710899-Lingulodinium_polyedra.AAC.1
MRAQSGVTRTGTSSWETCCRGPGWKGIQPTSCWLSWKTATNVAGPASRQWCCAQGLTRARSQSSMTSSSRPGRSPRPCGGRLRRDVGAEAQRGARAGPAGQEAGGGAPPPFWKRDR